MFKILSWNIQQGGGSRTSMIINALANAQLDIIILSEFKNNAQGKIIQESLLKYGFSHQGTTDALSSDNTVFIASKYPCEFEKYSAADPLFTHNILTAKFAAFNIMGVYLPHKKKHSLLPFITNLVQKENTPFVIAGDYNSGKNYIDQKGDSFWYQSELIQLEKANYKDAFRLKNGDMEAYSWFSHQGNGFRYDHTYVHEDLIPIVKNCFYLHDWRKHKWSDHSPMVVELG
jgi:exodeoxyribonuclease III